MPESSNQQAIRHKFLSILNVCLALHIEQRRPGARSTEKVDLELVATGMRQLLGLMESFP